MNPISLTAIYAIFVMIIRTKGPATMRLVSRSSLSENCELYIVISAVSNPAVVYKVTRILLPQESQPGLLHLGGCEAFLIRAGRLGNLELSTRWNLMQWCCIASLYMVHTMALFSVALPCH